VNHICTCRREPIVETEELTVVNRELRPGCLMRITNIPTIVRTGGHEPGVRRYYSMTTAMQLDYLYELARVRMRRGETSIELDFRDDATLGRIALNERARRERETNRRWYDRRMRRVPRFGSSDYYYERLRPAGPGPGEGENVPG
jgi:hypothetical protein